MATIKPTCESCGLTIDKPTIEFWAKRKAPPPNLCGECLLTALNILADTLNLEREGTTTHTIELVPEEAA